MTTYNLDANHAARVQDFKDCACKVAELAKSRSVIPGIPDLVVGIPNHHAGWYWNVWVEIKTEGGSLSPDQEDFRDEWDGYPYHIVITRADVVALVEYYQSLTPAKPAPCFSFGAERRL